MLLTITNTRRPATDLGYLLHKHPGRVQSFDLSFGRAHVFYPEAAEERCTAALLLDVDPIGLVRRRDGSETLAQYINDRPYVASSFLSVAISRVYGSALGGRCSEHPELVESRLPLETRIAALPCRGGEVFLKRLFEPLGYEVEATGHPLDERFPEWGESPYHTVRLRAECRLADLLSHLYVLVPVLDDAKHYWIGTDEVEKLLRHGAGWLAGHPEREAIAHRYLRHRRGLARRALERLVAEEEPDLDEQEARRDAEEDMVEERVGLNVQRMGAVVAALRSLGAKRVLDLGCGEGHLVRALLEDRSVEEIVGVDVSHRALERAAERLHLERLAPVQRDRVRLLHGSLVYRDARIEGFDAAAVVEVVEHLDPSRLAAFERVLFEFARPAAVVLTTPNRDYNELLETLRSGTLRHRDHRFEWTREEFRAWAAAISDRFGYAVRMLPVGSEDPALGPPTQMAVFTR